MNLPKLDSSDFAKVGSFGVWARIRILKASRVFCKNNRRHKEGALRVYPDVESRFLKSSHSGLNNATKYNMNRTHTPG